VPELPEVETVRRGLVQLTCHQPLQGGEVLLARTIRPVSREAFLAGLSGVAIASWQRRGKYLLAELVAAGAQAGWLGVHLRMSGQLLWLARSEPLHKHARVRLFFGADRELRFVDTRTFGQMWHVPVGVPPESAIAGLRALGPEPFAPEFAPSYLWERSRGRGRSVKAALLDQTLVAGIGNIYADEALFLSRIDPRTRQGDLTPAQVERLHAAIRDVLATAIARGGTTFNSFLNVLGVNGNYKHGAWVYGRAGELCRVCGSDIQRVKLAGRSSHFCPTCQV